MLKLMQIDFRGYKLKFGEKRTIQSGADIELIYLLLLQDANFIKCRRINIEIDENLDPEYRGRILHTGPIYSVWIKKPFSRYDNGLSEARMNLLDDVHEAFLLLCEKTGWETTVFEDAKKEIIENNFIIYIPLHQKIKSVNKQKLCAQLAVLPRADKYEYYVRFFKDEKFVCDVLIYEGTQTFIYWKELFNSCKWISKNEFCVFSRDKSITFKCFFEECKFELIVETVNEKESRLFEVWNYHTDYKRRMELSNIDENHLRFLLGENI